jgi:hypothetical protein
MLSSIAVWDLPLLTLTFQRRKNAKYPWRLPSEGRLLVVLMELWSGGPPHHILKTSWYIYIYIYVYTEYINVYLHILPYIPLHNPSFRCQPIQHWPPSECSMRRPGRRRRWRCRRPAGSAVRSGRQGYAVQGMGLGCFGKIPPPLPPSLPPSLYGTHCGKEQIQSTHGVTLTRNCLMLCLLPFSFVLRIIIWECVSQNFRRKHVMS